MSLNCKSIGSRYDKFWNAQFCSTLLLLSLIWLNPFSRRVSEFMVAVGTMICRSLTFSIFEFVLFLGHCDDANVGLFPSRCLYLSLALALNLFLFFCKENEIQLNGIEIEQMTLNYFIFRYTINNIQCTCFSQSHTQAWNAWCTKKNTFAVVCVVSRKEKYPNHTPYNSE